MCQTIIPPYRTGSPAAPPTLIAAVFLVTACSSGEPEVILTQKNPAALTSEDTHAYEITANAGQFVTGAIDQQSVDVVVTVSGPDGAHIGVFDVSARGKEWVRFETTAAGIHELEIAPFEDGEGQYAVGEFRQEPLATTPEAKVGQLMSTYGEDTPGGVVAVVREGRLVFDSSYGMANVEYGISNSISTPYHMASVSKQFTAMAIVMLSQQGLLGLDDDVRNYLPDVPDFGHEITLRHLLNHTSGLRDHWNLWAMSGGRMDDVIRQQDLLRLVHRQKHLNFEPGAEYLYCNTGYLLLSEVVTAVAGKPYGEWMSENVFEPIGMQSTQIYDDHERVVPGRAYSYRNSAGGLAKAVLSYANSGATSLFTTAEDLSLWLANFESGKVGGSEAIELLQEQGILNDGETIDYALGIGVSEQNGLRRLSHGGADAGFRTWLGYYPEIDAGVIVLGNVAGFRAGGIGVAVAEAFFAEQMSFDQSTTGPDDGAGEQAMEDSATWEPGPDDLAAYTGRFYSDELETFYRVSLVDNELLIGHRRHGEFPLTPQEMDVFRSDQWYIGTISFEHGPDDELTTMKVTSGRVRNMVFERVKY